MATMTMMTLVVLACVAGVFAVPTAAPAPAADGKYKHLTLPINERGTKFNEEADVDHDDKIVLFTVPDHNTVSNSKVMLDYNNRKVMTLFEKRKQCLLSDMPESMPSFERVEEGLNLVADPDVPTKIVRKTSEETNRRVLLDPVYDRTGLSEEMQKMCRDYEIHRVEEIGEEPEIEEGESDAKTGTSRVRRQLVINCPPFQWRWRCTLRTNSCIYYYTCDSTPGRPGQPPSSYACTNNHLYSGMGWQCEPFCPYSKVIVNLTQSQHSNMYVKLVALLLLLIHMVFSNKPALEKTWAVQLEGGREEAQRIAQRTGVTLVKQILGDYYLFKENNNVRRARLMDKESERRLKDEHSVKMVKEQLPHTRELYVHEEGHQGVVFNDQMWGSQTYLHTGDVHMNILPAWERTRKGEGLVVGVIDDGIFTNQPDLRDNLAAGLSYNVLEETTDPTPSFPQASHGTNCAGIIAAVHNNSFCGVGVAYKAKVSGIKMFAGAQAELSDAQEASALSHQYQSISVYSCSWGPSDWNNALEGPDTVAKEALVMAAREGRDGKGSVFVFSTGNGGSLNDSCAYNGYVNTNNTIGIGGLLQDGSIPSFAEACTSVFAVTLSRDYTGDTANMVVPHRATGCGMTFSGTSPAAAMAAGVFTLVLSANDQLSVRDVQHLVTRTSTNTGVCGQTWKENSAGFRVSDYCGFGLLDAGKLTAMAANWSCVPEQVSCTQQGEGASINIPQSGEVLTSITVQQDSCGVNYLEHVLLTVRATFPHRGHLQFRLTSPGGTVSDIVPGRATDMEAHLEWTFMTVHHWGERAEGSWQLSIRNTHPHLSNTGILEGWSLVFLGTATDPVNSSTGTDSTPGTDTTPTSVKTSSPSSEVFTRKSTSSRLGAQTTDGQTTQPTTTKLRTTQPTTTKSHTTQPTTAKLRTTQPTTTKLRTTQPSTTKSHTTQPTTAKLRTTQPTTTKSHTTQPTTAKLRTTQPTTTKLRTTQPSTTKLQTTQPTTTKSPTTQPSTTKSQTTQPSTTKSPTTQPSTTKSHTIQPTTTTLHTTQPSTSKVLTTQPSTTKLYTTQPSTTKLYTTQPSTTKLHTSTTKLHTTQPTNVKTQTVTEIIHKPAQRENLNTLLPGINIPASAVIISVICIIIIVAMVFAIWHCRRCKHNSLHVKNGNPPVLQAPMSKVSSHSSRHRSPQVSNLYSSEQKPPKEPNWQLHSHRYKVGNEEVQITFI
ncbi:PREDICTED: neuroendocrine convertase 1-like [Branchiostoma belcheri]|uniref:Neuroendocrine convertase 1-like n=1 Tax=Branchiostoma belcheri TaxID=7741 RepID=A0A6P5A256_BRABE|nr:PREDICTED: neuroendocrine convertase 1-like [Branchiostoma belcheri]